ncbi:MAG: PfkB family carbohydrate kinase, partial [Methylocella sp.]
LYQTGDFDTAAAQLRSENILGVVTRSEQGSLVVTRNEVLAVPAFPAERVVDTTGAGDLFAAGFLAGLSKSKDLETCARLGALAAAEIIQHIGARPLKDLGQLAAQNGIAI